MKNPFGDSLSAEAISGIVSKASFDIHRALGVGWPVEIYREALAQELGSKGLDFQMLPDMPVLYKNKQVGVYQPDFLISNVFFEIRNEDKLSSSALLQGMARLKACKSKVGYIINFGASKVDIKKVVDNPLL